MTTAGQRTTKSAANNYMSAAGTCATLLVDLSRLAFGTTADI